MGCHHAQSVQVRPLEFADRSERLRSSSEVQRFRVEFGQGLLIEAYAAGVAPHLLDHLAVGAAIGGAHPHIDAALLSLTFEVVRPAGARMNVHRHQVGTAPGHDLQVWRQAWQDTVADQARQPLFKIQRFAHTAHVAAGVFYADQYGPAGRVGEGHQGSQYALG